jgi:hypothetical protein
VPNLDTPAKRWSGWNPGCPWRGSWPIPDGTVGDGDRQQVDFMYSGILAGAAVIPDGEVPIVNPVQPVRALSVGRI